MPPILIEVRPYILVPNTLLRRHDGLLACYLTALISRALTINCVITGSCAATATTTVFATATGTGTDTGTDTATTVGAAMGTDPIIVTLIHIPI